MSNLVSTSDSYWYDVPVQSSPLLSKSTYLVQFLQSPGHPIFGFTIPEGSIIGLERSTKTHDSCFCIAHLSVNESRLSNCSRLEAVDNTEGAVNSPLSSIERAVPSKTCTSSLPA